MDLPFRCCLSGAWLWDLSSQSKTKPQGSECLLCSGVVSYRLGMDLQPQLQTAGLHSALWRTPSSQRHYTLQQVIAQTWDGPAPFPLPGRGWCQHHPLITHSPILFCLLHTPPPPCPVYHSLFPVHLPHHHACLPSSCPPVLRAGAMLSTGVQQVACVALYASVWLSGAGRLSPGNSSLSAPFSRALASLLSWEPALCSSPSPSSLK